MVSDWGFDAWASRLAGVYDYNGQMKEIQLREAKATLSAVVDEAVRGEPCVITRHGRREAVLIAYEEWEKLSRVPSFGRLLMSAPLEDGDLPKRNRKPLRHIGR